MKLATTISRLLLGLMFTFFGLNGFLHFLHQPPPQGLALQWLTAMSASHWMDVVFLIQLVAGVLLLLNQFIPVALVLLGPVIVNILLFHITMAPEGLPPGTVALVLYSIVFSSVRHSFAGIFANEHAPSKLPDSPGAHATQN